MRCEVLRPFPGPDGVKFQIGERVDTTDWKNREQLIAQRYIRPVPLRLKKSKPVNVRETVPEAPPAKKVRRTLAEV